MLLLCDLTFVLRDDTRNVFDENGCYVVLPIVLA